MKDGVKTKEQLITELAEMRQRIAELEAAETERVQAEDALRESEHRYRLLADNITDVIWTADLNLRFTYISPSITRMLGYSIEEAMAKTVEEVLTPASLDVAMQVFAEEMTVEEMEQKNLSRSRALELEYYCKDNSTIWVENKVTGLRDPDDRLVEILGVARDITKRKQAEEYLRQRTAQSEALEEAAAAVSSTLDLDEVLDRILE
ncbi:MAG: PAS domain S-box protein, partial [Anaerolineae bacterium]|nr:PAS domain S-box protein [Anaerolineae bacterium]